MGVRECDVAGLTCDRLRAPARAYFSEFERPLSEKGFCV